MSRSQAQVQYVQTNKQYATQARNQGGICNPRKFQSIAQQFWHLRKLSKNKDEIWYSNHLEKSYLNFSLP